MAADKGVMTSAKRLRAGIGVMVLAAIIAVAGAGAAAADPVPGPPPTPTAPPAADQVFARLIEADQRVIDAEVRLVEADQSSTEAARTAQRDRAAADAAASAFRAADRELDHQQVLRQQLTARAYVGGSGTDAAQLDELLQGRISDQTGRAVVMFGQVVNRYLQQIRVAQAMRGQALAEMRRTAALAPQTDEMANDRARLRIVAQDRLRRVLADRERLRAELRDAAARPQPQVSLDTPLLGLPQLTSGDLAAWFHASQRQAKTAVPVELLAVWFIDEGLREGVRGDIAFAQAVLETGGFTNVDSVTINNYAGIGHCDTCPQGFAFPTPQLGVRAQIQLLKSYAVDQPLYVNPLVDPRLHGPVGCCPTWGDLTRKWATAPTYGPAIMAIYTDLMQFALRRHAVTLPVG